MKINCIGLTKSIFRNLYRKYYLNRVSYSKTKIFLKELFSLSDGEIQNIEREFEEIFNSDSFLLGGEQAVLRDDAFALYSVVRIHKPILIVETGTYQGYSSHVIIEGLKRNNVGKFITCDVLDHRVFKNDFSDGRFQFLLGLSRVTFGLIPFNDVSLFFHDSDHRYPNVLFEIGFAVQNNVKIILCHDFSKRNIHNRSKAKNSKGCREGFIDAIGQGYSWYEIPTINGIGIAIRH